MSTCNSHSIPSFKAVSEYLDSLDPTSQAASSLGDLARHRGNMGNFTVHSANFGNYLSAEGTLQAVRSLGTQLPDAADGSDIAVKSLKASAELSRALNGTWAPENADPDEEDPSDS